MKLTMTAALSFVLGAWLFHTPSVNADLQDTGNAHVFIAPVEMFNTKAPASLNLPGARIAGISCVTKPKPKLPDAAICYVATALD